MEILSNIGVGQIRFGMSIDEVRGSVNSEVRSFMKSPQSQFPTDSFLDSSIHVFYKTPGVCEAVELYSPANPTLNGQEFIGRRFSAVRDWLEVQDDALEIEYGSVISYSLGIALYIPDLGEIDALIESLLVFERGYYSS